MGSLHPVPCMYQVDCIVLHAGTYIELSQTAEDCSSAQAAAPIKLQHDMYRQSPFSRVATAGDPALQLWSCHKVGCFISCTVCLFSASIECGYTCLFLCSGHKPTQQCNRCCGTATVTGCVLPHCCCLCRVPFVFAGLHCRSLSLSTPAISALLGCYQLSRVAGNRTVKLLGPRTSLLAGAACGLVGYIALAASSLQLAPQPTAAAAVGDNDTGSSAALQLLVLGACLCLVGLSEQVTALQVFCKRRYQHDAAAVRTRLLQQVSLQISAQL